MMVALIGEEKITLEQIWISRYTTVQKFGVSKFFLKN